MHGLFFGVGGIPHTSFLFVGCEISMTTFWELNASRMITND